MLYVYRGYPLYRCTGEGQNECKQVRCHNRDENKRSSCITFHGEVTYIVKISESHIKLARRNCNNRKLGLRTCI